jgi:hypothetical protein
MRRYFAASAAALMCSTLAFAQSTSPTTPPQTQPPAPSAAQPASTTLTGCVYNEKDVPGRAPNVAERAGVMEDYILADVRPAGSTPGATGTSGTAGAAGTAGTAAASAMYKLEHASDDQLKAMVGKRVEVTGRIDAESGDAKSAAGASTSQADRAIGRDKVDLAEFEVSSIREVEGTCPAKPAGR